MDTIAAPQRANARRNRAALIAAAREVMGRRGLDAPLDEIAQHAGVGNATLYRHFPTRCALVVAVFTEQMTDYAHAARTAAESPQPWEALGTYLATVGRLQAQNRALADLLTRTDIASPELSTLRRDAHRDVVGVIDRAQQTGRLRADVTAEDVLLILMANAGVIARTGDHAPAASPRLIALLLDGLAASAAGAATRPPAPSAPTMLRAMRSPH